MNTQCYINQLHFQGLGTKKVIADFNSGTIKSDAGALLLREIDSANNFIDWQSMGNLIKEQQLYLFADRTSSAMMKANQLRLYFSSLAYVLMNELRSRVLAGIEFAKA